MTMSPISQRSLCAALVVGALAAIALITPTLGPASSATETRSSPAAPPACHRLGASPGRREGALGTTFQTINVRNRSRHSCTVSGFARVAYVNRHHIMIGWPATDNPGRRTVTLRPGHTTRFALGYPNPGNFSPIDCLAHKAHQLRIRMTADPTPSFVRFNQVVCTTKFGRPFVTAYGF